MVSADGRATEIDLRTTTSQVLLRLPAGVDRPTDAVPPSPGPVLVESTGRLALLQHWSSWAGAGRRALPPQTPRRWRHWSFCTRHGRSDVIITSLVLVTRRLRAGDIQLDGAPLTGASWTVIDGRDCRAAVVRVSVAPGWHRVSLRGDGRVDFTATAVNGLPLVTRAVPAAAATTHDARHLADSYATYDVPPAPLGGQAEINFQPAEPAYQENSADWMSISTTLLSVILSLSAAVFFVAICIIGFVAADFSYQHGYFRTCKVTPYYPP